MEKTKTVEILFPEFCNLYGDISNMKYLKKCIDIRNWKRQTKTGAVICAAVIIVMIVLAAVKPSEQEMLSHTSPAMQKMIEKDAESSRKRVTVTYSSLWVI